MPTAIYHNSAKFGELVDRLAGIEKSKLREWRFWGQDTYILNLAHGAVLINKTGDEITLSGKLEGGEMVVLGRDIRNSDLGDLWQRAIYEGEHGDELLDRMLAEIQALGDEPA